MKVLIVGGTGMIGGHAAFRLEDEGHEVVIGARKPADARNPVARFPVLIGDYTTGGFTPQELEGFDAVVFSAGNDTRHLPRDADVDAFWRLTQIEGVPNFAARAKEAGVGRLVQIGSYYHQVMPEVAERNPYVRARMLADEGARAHADRDFNVSTLNAPAIVGALLGRPERRFEGLMAWARGERPDIGFWAPAGGTNYMSIRSLTQAISGALAGAESGKAYLIGDENLTYAAFFQMFFDCVGADQRIVSRDEEHPLMPDFFIVQGRGNMLSYEPDPEETRMLGYDRNDVRRAVAEVVSMIEATRAAP